MQCNFKVTCETGEKFRPEFLLKTSQLPTLRTQPSSCSNLLPAKSQICDLGSLFTANHHMILTADTSTFSFLSTEAPRPSQHAPGRTHRDSMHRMKMHVRRWDRSHRQALSLNPVKPSILFGILMGQVSRLRIPIFV
jgi:hypothetical protein